MNYYENTCGECHSNHNGYCMQLRRSGIKAEGRACKKFTDVSTSVPFTVDEPKVCSKCQYWYKDHCAVKDVKYGALRKACTYFVEGSIGEVLFIDIEEQKKRIKAEQSFRIRESYKKRMHL